MWLWRILLSLAPTAALQRALLFREGVTIIRLAPDERRAVDIGGPCILTINRD